LFLIRTFIRFIHFLRADPACARIASLIPGFEGLESFVERKRCDWKILFILGRLLWRCGWNVRYKIVGSWDCPALGGSGRNPKCSM